MRYASADEPTLRGADWIAQQWEATRIAIAGKAGAILVLDEIQKIRDWSETVKRLWAPGLRRSFKRFALNELYSLVAMALI